MFQVNHSFIPKNPSLLIFSYLDAKDLSAIAQTCKKGKEWADDPTLWKNLFERTFHKAPASDVTAQEAFKREIRPKQCTKGEISRIARRFLCDLEWNKKKELEIVGSSDRKLLIQLGFGPNRGIQESFDTHTIDTREYYHCKDLDNSNSLETKEYIIQESLNTIPIYVKILVLTPIERSIQNVVDHYFDYNALSRMVTKKTVYYNAGWGNTLGYFSKVNDWKKPFKFFCTNNNDAWTGRIPYHFDYKFVLIDSNNNITWEKGEGNRVDAPDGRVFPKLKGPIEF